MVQAIWKGKVLAQSDKTTVVEGNYYFPSESVDRQYFRQSDHQSECAWKGTASYLDVVVDGEVNKDAAWYYPTPKEAAAEITGAVAFWKGVEVQENAGN